MPNELLRRAGGALCVSALLLSACGDDDSGDDEGGAPPGSMADGVEAYADGVLASYRESLQSARRMEVTIKNFLADPSDDTLRAAREAWIQARVDYGPTEAFRFYGGPIDNAKTGTEGFINAWPLDEAYIDYVEGDPTAGIINHPEEYPTIDEKLLLSLNERGGEANIATGWHAIEFLLWGQDLSKMGPGDRPIEDFTTGEHAERRRTYLRVTTELLIEHLEGLVDAWSPRGKTYRDEFLAMEPTDAMSMLITGIGELSRGELAGERMNVAYSERSQENEHSCFSDNTTADLLANAVGIQNVVEGTYPNGVEGTGLADLVAAEDPELAEQLRADVAASVQAIQKIPAPFDQHLRNGVPDTDPGRESVLTAIEALEKQATTIVSAADALSVKVNVT